MAGIPDMDIDTLLSSRKMSPVAPVCWILIGADAGSTNTLAGVKMLKHEIK
jgi:hypothetical protein